MAKWRSLLVLPGLFVASALVGGIYGPKLEATPAPGGQIPAPDPVQKMTQVYDVIAANYAVPVDPSTAIYDGAIPAMLHVLDPHSGFYDPKAFARLEEEQAGRYFGVGMLVGPSPSGDPHTIVIQPFEGTPAYQAGLRPGDVIVAVDNKSTDGLTTDDVAALLKGPAGTTVHVSVHRAGHVENLTFTLVRKQIQHNSVESDYEISPGVQYIYLTGFTETSTSEMKQILQQAEEIHGLVLDLRGNPGGILNQAISIADLFLAKNQVVVSDHGRASQEQVLRTSTGNGGHDYPLVILVDNMTASAAEIVSGAVQDHDRGIIAGQTTFGKGLVQSVFQMHDNTGLVLTSAHYYTPSGRLIQRPYEGISMYDYFWAHDQTVPNTAGREVKLTDVGRTVYGGGGITPDVILPAIVLNDFQQMLLDRNAFFDFSDAYLGRRDTVAKDWQPEDSTVKEFETFLAGQNLTLKPADVAANGDWLKQQIQYRIFASLYGLNYADQVRARTDPEIKRAVELLPQAASLESRARQVLTARQQGPTH